MLPTKEPGKVKRNVVQSLKYRKNFIYSCVPMIKPHFIFDKKLPRINNIFNFHRKTLTSFILFLIKRNKFYLSTRSQVFVIAIDEEESDKDGDRSRHHLHHLLAPLSRVSTDEDLGGSRVQRGKMRHGSRVFVDTRLRQQVFVKLVVVVIL